MNARNFRPLTMATAIAAVLAATTLAACDRGQQADRTANQQERTAGQKLDSTMSKAQEKLDSAKNDMAQGAADAKRDIKNMANDAKDKVNDATITASVNAKLAGDKELSALRINVDTVDGRVALHGSAPNAEARDRATQLASAVDGVKSVENQLVISSKS